MVSYTACFDIQYTDSFETNPAGGRDPLATRGLIFTAGKFTLYTVQYSTLYRVQYSTVDKGSSDSNIPK